nr:MAG TPA: hypothetical protein [Caudoviricetes sp.]
MGCDRGCEPGEGHVSMGRQAVCGVVNWLTWKACDPSRIFFAMTVWYSGAILWGS